MPSSIDISRYDYNLPSERIAKFPLDNRDDSKLLIYNNHNIEETIFNQLDRIIPENTLLVFNNTKVIRARLNFFKSTGARIEIFCLEPYNPSNSEEAFQQKESVEWICMIGNLKKWKEGEIFAEVIINNTKINIFASIVKKMTDGVVIRFSWDNGTITFAEILDGMGQTPIPPYLEREAVELDSERYQTVYSKYKGSVAAPTAGLHFTDSVLERLSTKGVKSAELTLHVGAGTFKPVKSVSIYEHEMHTEHFSVPLNALKQISGRNGNIIAVGTTSVRTLESLYIAGIKCSKGIAFDKIEQWDGFEFDSDLTVNDSFNYLIKYMEQNRMSVFNASTTIMIVPGFRYKVIDGLITNFHQPRSTLLLLIAALVGDDWEKIYNYALENDFRFLSYGDSSLLINGESELYRRG